MQNTINIVREALREASIYDLREIQSITELLLEEVCAITRTERLMHPERILDPSVRQRMEQIARQLRQGVPVQQAMGYAWFCGKRFVVSPDVLIPRPETEELIEWICNTTPAQPSILDIGTGSGCIAVTLGRLINNANILAIDISTAALSIALRNACQQHVNNVHFAQSDILTAVDNPYYRTVIHPLSTAYPQAEETDKPGVIHTYQQYDVIVSNPPYICQHEAAAMSPNVLHHEPHLALFVPDDDALLFYRAIARFGLLHLKVGGSLYFEINAAYGQQTCHLLSQLGYCDVELRQDINGRDRMVKARLYNRKNEKQI